MKPTIEVVNDILCVKSGFYDSLKPQIIYNHWPIGNGVGYAKDYIGAELWKTNGSHYRLRLSAYNYVEIYLVDQGKTKSIKVTFEPIPKPKTRVKTRWHNGKWEKLLKSKGWVIV